MTVSINTPQDVWTSSSTNRLAAEIEVFAFTRDQTVPRQVANISRDALDGSGSDPVVIAHIAEGKRDRSEFQFPSQPALREARGLRESAMTKRSFVIRMILAASTACIACGCSPSFDVSPKSNTREDPISRMIDYLDRVSHESRFKAARELDEKCVDTFAGKDAQKDAYTAYKRQDYRLFTQFLGGYGLAAVGTAACRVDLADARPGYDRVYERTDGPENETATHARCGTAVTQYEVQFNRFLLSYLHKTIECNAGFTLTGAAK